MNDQRASLEAAIGALESQRALLGSAVVDIALAPLRQQLAALQSKSAETDQERRQATVLFADMSGYTAVSERLDAEEVAGLVNLLWEQMDDPIREHRGRIISHAGDAVMAVWGTDQTREDEPAQAVRCALAMQALLARIRAQHGYAIAMRIGLNTGPVLLGGVGTIGEYSALGDTVNLASRLEHEAPVGGILISHATYRHIVGGFDCTPQPPLRVKGKTELIQTYLVTGERKRSFRAPGRGIQGVTTPMIGRDREFAALKAAVERALLSRKMSVATVVAEAGVGKSRLLLEFGRWLEATVAPSRIIEGRAGPESRYVPNSLLRDAISVHLEIEANDSPATARAKLQQVVRETLLPQDVAAVVPATRPPIYAATSPIEVDRAVMRADLIAYVLGFDVAGSVTVESHLGDKSALRTRGIRYLAELLRAFSRRAPVLMVLEDIHWADDSSMDALMVIMQELRSERVAVIGAARPDFLARFPRWQESVPQHELVRLEALPVEQSRMLVAEILRKVARLPNALRDSVVTHAEGNPYYVEELIKMLMEDGVISTETNPWQVHANRLASLKIPPTLMAVLQARLDSLPKDERQVLQRASVVGRVFWDEAVAEVGRGHDTPADFELNAVRARLLQLQAKEMVYSQNGSAFSPVNELQFKHALMRDATYESVLIRDRKRFHQRVAEWLVAHSGGRRDEIEAVIGEHFEKAGETNAAIRSYHKAGNHAFQRSAFAEARFLFERAQSLIGPDDPLADDLGVRLGETRLRLGDYKAARTILNDSAAVAHARGNLAGEAEAYSYLSTLELNVGNKAEAKRCIAQSLALARERGDEPMIAHGLIELAWAHFRMGERPEAQRCFAESSERFERLQQAKGLARAHSGLAVMADLRGDFPAARRHRETALVLYRSIGCRQGVCVVYNDLGEMERLQANYTAARRHYEDALKVAREIDDVRSAAIALANIGHTHVALSEDLPARQAYEQGIDAAMSVSAVPWVLDSLAGLAITLARAQQETDAIRILRTVSRHAALYDDTKPVIAAAVSELRKHRPASDPEAALQAGTPEPLEDLLAQLARPAAGK